MASTRKSPTSSALLACVTAVLRQHVKRGDRLIAGLSGGIDSVVLLDILARIARQRRFALAALHVNHQISPNAARWTGFCRELCRARGIPLRVVKASVARGDSLEAAARAARYAAYRSQRADYVALAHNQDDQAETLLLQLLRGAGVKGLSAMPVVREGILRPLLDVTRGEILAYATERRLRWVEDESNEDTYFLRNFLRHEVLPVIARRVPAYRATVARAARHLAEAAGLLDALAANDGAGSLKEDTLSVDALRRLPPARARNLLRYFLARREASMPSAERLDEALRQACTAKPDSRVRIELGEATLRRYAGRLHVVREAAPFPAGYERRWRGEQKISLPELGGVLVLARARGEGISLARLQTAGVTFRVRRGGERLRPDCRRPRRSLKNLLQEARIPPWERERLPLIYCGKDLVWAPGVGVSCSFQATSREPSLRPVWKVAA